MWNLDGERLLTAQSRFRAFFEELDTVFIEREDTLKQVALALLAREHMLMTGPPGTGKSALASAVIGRIPDERTGAPSVFARQITESTVNTDLVGPIDFKTLMSSGRTEHFTDEGMLGAVHAFLDEVLDGRDMLLRSTLNLLQERELKHGHRITKGEIEAALMTTNRYMSDVLERSRETLLAFVDRIAFVNFVPRGFADEGSMATLLEAMVGGAGFARLRCLLTVQDLDILQEAVDAVQVSPDMTARLSIFLRELDTELAAARRADPRFTPTRYLSTRTAVRLGRVLRASVVYDRAMRGSKRPLRVEDRDFKLLRTSLLLTGPTRKQVQALLERETDPTERRQLEIVQREREIFDAVLERLPKTAQKDGKPMQLHLPTLRELTRKALRSEGTAALVDAAERLTEAIERGWQGTDAAHVLLRRVLEELVRRATVLGMTVGIGPEESVHELAGQIAETATRIEQSARHQRPLARWLRAQAIAMIDHTIAHAPSLLGKTLDEHLKADPSVEEAMAASKDLLFRARALLEQRDHLASHGADVRDPDGAARRWSEGLEAIERALVPFWDDVLRGAVERALEGGESRDLSALFDRLAPTLSEIDEATQLLSTLRGEDAQAPGTLKARVAGPRIAPLVRASFERFDARERLQISREVDELLAHLEGAGLGGALDPGALLQWTAAATLRTERGSEGDPEALPANFPGYRQLRAKEPRVSITYVLLDVVTRVYPLGDEERADPARVEQAAFEHVGALPAEVQSQVVDEDLGRTARAVRLLERWLEQVSAAPADGELPLDALVESRFLHVAFDEGALGRFALEAEMIGRVFPAARGRAEQLAGRIEALEQRAQQLVLELHRRGADLRWARVAVPGLLAGDGQAQEPG